MKKFEEYFLLSRRITLFAEALGFYSEALPDFLPEMLYPFFWRNIPQLIMADYKDVPIRDVLEALGARKAGKNMYYSTFRKDSSPSMSVSFSKNVWYDHGVGKGGGPVELVMETLGCPFREAKAFIAGIPSGVAAPVIPSDNGDGDSSDDGVPGIEVKSVREISSRRLLFYGWKRGIPWRILTRYCGEAKVAFTSSGKECTLLSFENNAGGYVLRSTGKMKISSKAGITTFDAEGERSVVPTSDKVFIFEGFFDFLSWKRMAEDGHADGEGDCVVLNSVANVESAMAFISSHGKMVSYLDADEAGRNCLQTIRRRFPSADVVDMAESFGECKDLNEVLVERIREQKLRNSDIIPRKTLPERK